MKDYRTQIKDYQKDDYVNYAIQSGVFRIDEKYNFEQYDKDKQDGVRIQKRST